MRKLTGKKKEVEEALCSIYDLLYDVADAIIKKANACDIDKDG